MELERLLKQGRFVQVNRETDRLLCESTSQEATGELLVLKSIALMNLQNYYGGMKAAERALALEGASLETIGMAHFMLGTNAAHVGDTHVAIQHLEAFLGSAHTLDHSERCRRQQPNALFNIANCLRQRHEYDQAVTYYQAAYDLFLSTDRFERAMQCKRDILWIHLLAGDSATAEPLLSELGRWVSEVENATWGVKHLVDTAFFHFVQGEYGRAIGYCEEVFAPGRIGTTEDQLIQASWIAGESMLALGHLEGAGLLANLTIHKAVDAKWSFFMNRGRDLQTRVNAARGNTVPDPE